MKHFFPISAVIFAFVFPAMVLARATDPPCEITFKTKNGDVLFPHQKHVDKVEKKCDVCHDKVFAKDSKAPLNFKDKMHKTAEASMLHKARPLRAKAIASNAIRRSKILLFLLNFSHFSRVPIPNPF